MKQAHRDNALIHSFGAKLTCDSIKKFNEET